MIRAEIRPEILRWARERAGFSVADLRKRVPKLGAWERGEIKPTLRQLEDFAKAVYIPVGYLFLSQPVVERVPIPDYRIGRNRQPTPSPNLLDTLYLCEARQDWYRDFARTAAEPLKPFVGSMSTRTPVKTAAAAMRQALGFDLEARRKCPTWTDALRQFIAQADVLGILVMCSGVVLNNNRRTLDPDEFRGFAMSDVLAPLVFINGADTKSAQMFTLAHELGHLWLGQSALTDADPSTFGNNEVEKWCNQVAAELLVPLDVLRDEIRELHSVPDEMTRLARRFKVSTLVILRRIFDAGLLTRTRFNEEYAEELDRLSRIERGSGGNFYLTQGARVSKRFASALVESTLEGRTLYRDALRMLGISKVETFHELGRTLDVTI